jgi:hypothetical protein
MTKPKYYLKPFWMLSGVQGTASIPGKTVFCIPKALWNEMRKQNNRPVKESDGTYRIEFLNPASHRPDPRDFYWVPARALTQRRAIERKESNR